MICRGGGVGLYIIVFSIRDDLPLMREKIFESIFVDVIFNEKTVTCGAVYRSSTETSTNVSFLTNLNGCLYQKFCQKVIVLLGVTLITTFLIKIIDM